MTNIPAHLARYWRAEPTDAASPPRPMPLRPCRWADCPDQRSGAMFCSKHSSTARRAIAAGRLPPMEVLEEMRPPEIAALTRAPKPPPPVVTLPPRPASPSRLCLWPDCGRSATYRNFCARCQTRRRRLILRGILPDVPATPENAATMPALWAQHCQRVHLHRRLRGLAAAPPLVPDPAPTPGVCIIEGCGRTDHKARGLCARCRDRARRRKELERFPAKNKRRLHADQ